MLPVHQFEFSGATLLTVEKLQHHNPREMLLQVRIDLGDGYANPPVALCHAAPEHDGRGNHQGHGRYTAAHYWWDMMRGENAAKPAIPGGGNVPLLMRGCIA